MSLKETIQELKELLNNISHDLEKAEIGNKAASQRVRTGTVQLEKIAKSYRRESIEAEKLPEGSRKAAPASKKNTPSKAPAPKAKAAPAKASMALNSKAKPAKAKAAVAKVRGRPLTVRRSTAKLPVRSL